MQSRTKQVVIDTRQVTLELMVLAARAVAAGLAVSIAAAVLIVGLVTLAS